MSIYLRLLPDGGRYFSEDATNCKVEVLADWLTDDVSTRCDSWRKWLNDNSEKMQDTESNATWLEKYGDKILMGAITHIMIFEHEGLSTPEEYKVMISIKNAIELIDSWEGLIKTCPLRLILYEENGIYRLEAVQ